MVFGVSSLMAISFTSLSEREEFVTLLPYNYHSYSQKRDV